MSEERRSRNGTARSVWSAPRLAGVFDRQARTKAGASSTHSKRFAIHRTPGKSSRPPSKLAVRERNLSPYFALYLGANPAVIESGSTDLKHARQRALTARATGRI